MMNIETYVQYLISSPGNVTGTYLAEHLDGVSHDVISTFLRQRRVTARQLWSLVKDQISDSPDACLIIDDSVQDKRYSKAIALVRRQWSGNEHAMIRGIGVVNLVHTAGPDGDFWPIDYRIYAPEADGKTKNDHFQEMLLNAVTHKTIQAKTVLFDSWYAATQNLKLVHRLGLVFWTVLKSNRLVSLDAAQGMMHLDAIDWDTEQRATRGVVVRLKDVPFPVRLFKIVAPDGRIDWVVTNNLDETLTTQVAETSSDVRWQVEEYHRGYKQLTKSEGCQARKGRSQRTHLACCVYAWIALKVYANRMGVTVYQAQARLFREYLRAELRAPRIPAIQPA